jgi:hypothetical protein
MLLRPLTDDDRSAYSRMLHRAFNAWYGAHGWPSAYFGCTPEQAGIFLDIYGDISPGRSVETHLLQVRGKFQPFNGVSLPSFLPETG